MRIILILFIALSSAPPRTIPVHIIIVNSQYATIDNPEPYRQSVINAFDYWGHNIAGEHIYQITEVSTIYVSSPFTNEWLHEYATLDSEAVEIYIVANTNQLFLQQYAGVASPNHNLIVVVEHSLQGLEPTLAHELGHLLHNLPDWYLIPGKCNTLDIMCHNPARVYQWGNIGCLSRAELGIPCYYVNLPAIQN